MAPRLSSLYTLSFALAVFATLLVAATLRLLAILPNPRSKTQPWRKPPHRTRLLVVLGSGGHTHEMFCLLRDLDTSKYTHRTYIVSSGDSFSAQRAVDFERNLEARAQQANLIAKAKTKEAPRAHKEEQERERAPSTNKVDTNITDPNGTTTTQPPLSTPAFKAPLPHLGPQTYNIALVPRARRIHQSLLTTPFSSLHTLYACFAPLLHAPWFPSPPDLIITNGPATAVIVVLASLLLRFLDVRGAHSRRKCRTVYVESFARVETLSLSGRLLLRLVDRFLVQWEALEGVGGRAEFCGVLV